MHVYINKDLLQDKICSTSLVTGDFDLQGMGSHDWWTDNAHIDAWIAFAIHKKPEDQH